MQYLARQKCKQSEIFSKLLASSSTAVILAHSGIRTDQLVCTHFIFMLFRCASLFFFPSITFPIRIPYASGNHIQNSMPSNPYDEEAVQAMLARGRLVAAAAVTEAPGRQAFWADFAAVADESDQREGASTLTPATRLKHVEAEGTLEGFLLEWARHRAGDDRPEDEIIAAYLSPRPTSTLPLAFWKLYVRFLTHRKKLPPNSRLVSRTTLLDSVCGAMSAFERLTELSLSGNIRRNCLDLAKSIDLTERCDEGSLSGSAQIARPSATHVRESAASQGSCQPLADAPKTSSTAVCPIVISDDEDETPVPSRSKRPASIRTLADVDSPVSSKRAGKRRKLD